MKFMGAQAAQSGSNIPPFDHAPTLSMGGMKGGM